MRSSTTKIALVVLAAGDSTRMGSPKALLDWHGRPLLRHILDTAIAGGCHKSVVVLGRDAALIRSQAALSDTDVVINNSPDDGQISSLKLGLSSLGDNIDCAICWPVDCPLIQANDVKALISAFTAKLQAKHIFIPTYQNERGHPMLIDSCMHEDFMNLEAGKTARDQIVRLADYVTEVPVNNSGILTDIDTPEQYKQALQVRQ